MKKILLISLALVSLSAFAGNMTTKLIVNNPLCHGSSDGSIDLYIFGGNAPFTYTWDNNLPATSSHSGLAAGIYSFTVSDNDGDVVSGSVAVAEPNEIMVVPNVINVSAPGGHDGSIGLYVNGGTPNYSYSWSNSVMDKNISSLTAGTYTVEVMDAVGCTKTVSFIVNEPNGFIAQKPEDKYITTKGNMDKIVYKNGGTTGVEAIDNKAVVYPNPANNFFNISLNNSTPSQIALINPNGEVVAQQNSNSGEAQMNVSNLSNGNYILSIRTENGVTNQLVSVLK